MLCFPGLLSLFFTVTEAPREQGVLGMGLLGSVLCPLGLDKNPVLSSYTWVVTASISESTSYLGSQSQPEKPSVNVRCFWTPVFYLKSVNFLFYSMTCVSLLWKQYLNDLAFTEMEASGRYRGLLWSSEGPSPLGLVIGPHHSLGEEHCNWHWGEQSKTEFTSFQGSW
jgi:hypothetical protein